MSHLLRKAALSAIGGSLLVATLGLAPAAAEKPDTPPGQAHTASHSDERPADRHERSDRDGDADSDRSTGYTEDDDTNDGGTRNNVEDDGDNRHPSGRDRSVENGGSGNQGRSESDPDDDGRGPDRSNGGPDKPNGAGGDDLADQDGNNGCGNDDDFEDDNEGWCGKPADKPAPAKPEAKPETKPAATPCPDGSMDRPCAAKPEATPEHKPVKPETKPEVKPGNGTADIDVDADCLSVTVTSSKDISHVVVTFADGTSEKFDGLKGHTWTKTFTKTVASAKAKSATTVVTDMAGSCTADEAAAADADEHDECTAGAMDEKCDEDDEVESTERTSAAPGGFECPKGDDMDDDGGVLSRLCELVIANDADDDDTEVLAGEATRGGGAGAYDTASLVSARSAGGGMLASLPIVGSVVDSVIGGQLPMTGISTLSFLIVAMAAMVIGFLLVRASRRTKAGAAS